eukprot:2715636-Pyramimonas_sp.AAC.1
MVPPQVQFTEFLFDYVRFVTAEVSQTVLDVKSRPVGQSWSPRAVGLLRQLHVVVVVRLVGDHGGQLLVAARLKTRKACFHARA